jgi:lipoprotein-anchoring transpeptidase ErfK/SrfK
MKPRLIQSSITAALGEVKDAPSEVVYLPEGIHTITPFVDGKPQEVTVNVSREKGESIAASLQASLAQRNTQNVRPWFDFEHKGGAASAIPTAFRYEDGKATPFSPSQTGSAVYSPPQVKKQIPSISDGGVRRRGQTAGSGRRGQDGGVRTAGLGDVF